MSIRLLNGVELVQSPITACTTCRSNITTRKLEALYLANPEQKNGTSAYLLTDLWYCQRCDKGFVLAAFRQVTDSYNRKWIIKELTKSAQPAALHTSKQQAGNDAKVLTSNNSDLKVKTIDFILQDHENKCPNCKMLLTKISIQLQLVKGEQVEYMPCSALKCESCQKWMLRRHHFIALQTNFQPFIIPLSHTVQRPPALQSKNKLQGSGEKNHSAEAGAGNRQYNRYGVFLPSPTGRKGYFDE